MKQLRTLLTALSVIAVTDVVFAQPVVTLVGINANYRYFKGFSEASTPTTIWRTNGFDDSSWINGNAPFAYDTTANPDYTIGAQTLLTDMQNNYRAVFQRHSFNVSGASAHTNLVLRHLIDDGVIVWLNGIEIFRTNMGSSGMEFSISMGATNANDPPTYTTTTLPPSTALLLREGTNVLACQGQNINLASSDFIISVELRATLTDSTALIPTVATLNPSAGNVFALSNITVTFSEPVRGVDATDLLINGTAAAGVTGGSNVWTWRFSQPAYGGVNITWAGAANITDFDIPPKPFSGAPFGYSLINPSAPTISGQVPVADSSLSTLTQVQVSFSEAVTNVNAADLLVNGVAATGLSGGGSNYTFTFAQPPDGTVFISWASGHGITDTEAGLNGFDSSRPGATWSYTLGLSSTVLIPSNSVWRYVKGYAEASSPTQAWRQVGFPFEPNWYTGSAPLFFGETYSGGTVLDMQSAYQCIYLRHKFVLGTPTAVISLIYRHQIDDGMVVWINGTEVLRTNVPGAPADPPFLLPGGVGTASEPNAFNSITNAVGLGSLVAGTNVIAVQAFNVGIHDADFGFNLQFEAIINSSAPLIISQTPTANTTVTNLTQLTVTFSEDVIGVDASDLLVNGSPATGISGSGAARTFTFAQPAYGSVSITWAAGHGITDPGNNPFNALVAGATWNYTLQPPTVALVATNANYRYFKGFSEASTPTTLWRTNGFNDSSWANGNAPFAYDTDPSGVNLTNGAPTVLHDMQNGYVSFFQRHSFNLAGAGAYTNLVLRHRIDDGVIVWLNGMEIFRTNMGAGRTEYLFDQLAFTFATDPAGYTSVALPVSAASLLREGNNVLALQGHNASWESSDFITSVELLATVMNPTALPPAVTQLNPAAGNVFALSNITVTFSEAVQGIDAADLLINGISATGVSGISNVWTWIFPQPSYGNVNVTWAGGAGVTDFDVPPKPFVGSPFSYTLLNPSAPTVTAQAPLASSAVSNLTQVQVSFSESVQGVDAVDLSVNSIPATGVSGSAGNYTFTFAQPPYGTVLISWAAGHGITDIEPAQNAFDATRAGSTWQYTLVDLTVPAITAQSPPANANVTNLTQLSVTFSEAVVGVNASDLRINGVPATGVSGGPATYTFTFPPPNSSLVNVTWAVAHGITDTAVQPNSFNAGAPGATWQYFTPDNVPPAVATISPPAVSTIRDLAQIVITFAEPVTGVSAGDLLIKGLPAQTVSGSAAGPYTFGFTQPATGTVEIAWAALHGITDLAVPPNSFGGGVWSYTLNPNAVFANKIVINEIMFHPSTERTNHEWIELHNTDVSPVNLAGWQFTKGVSFVFPNVTIAADGYLVVASSIEQFQEKHLGVTNVIGNWAGQLANTDEEIQLETASGEEVDVVHYASEGDWAVRQRGPLDLGSRGWEWFSPADGTNFNTATLALEGGRSLELRNPLLPNQYGQNWAFSPQTNGTPGTTNGALTSNIPPMILDVAHFPLVPTSTDQVTITARVRDEQTNGHSVALFQRNHTSTTPPAFAGQIMFDDGAHNDGLADDGVYGAILAAQPNGTVIEFYVRAIDGQQLTNTWPAAARQVDGSFQQTANALYQVDNEAFTTNMPLYRVILTGSEANEYYNQLNNQSDAEMNATFISIDGEGTKVRYRSGMRIRGAGSRGGTPKNNRVNIATDNRWNGLNEINLNNRHTHAQAIGAALALKSGLPAANARPVQYRINGVNLASSGAPQYGAYVFVEPINGDWAENHYPNDGDGNAYRGSRFPWTANLDYQGTNAQTYIDLGYSKTSNQSDNDWRDLFNLTFALNQIAPDTDYVQAVLTNVNVTNFMRFFAVGSVMSFRETSLLRGVGDDYAMYRGVVDPRFTLVPHDFDTILNQGDSSGQVGESIFEAVINPQSGNTTERANFLQRFVRHPQFVPIYFAELKRLAETVFAASNLNPLVDQVLGDWPAATTMPSIKSFAANRTANVLSQIPLSYSVVHTLSLSNGVARSTSPTVTLHGTANAIDTRSVRVSGLSSVYSAWEGRWTNSTVTLRPGFNNLLIEAVGVNNAVVWSTNLVVWYDAGTFNDQAGTIAADAIWSPGAGPHRLTANVIVANGVILTIQPGTTVYLNSGVSLHVANGGRLLAEGTSTAGIQFRPTPGAGARWGGIVINGSGASPESRITYAHIEGNNNTGIDVRGGDAFLDHLTFGTTDRRYMDLDGASFVVSHCVFPSVTTGLEPVHGTGGIRAGGRGIFIRNFFGKTSGYNDTVDFTGGNRPGPIVQVLDNVFTGSDDDILDFDGTDAWIEGNIFLHVHRNGSPDSASAVSGGDDSGQTSEITIIGNIFYDVDQAAMAKQGNFYNFINNTVVRQSSTGFQDAGQGAILNFADEGIAQALGMYVEGNIIFDAERLTRHVTNATPVANNTTFNNNLMPFVWAGNGTNNSSANPLLTYVPQLAETMTFNSWASAQVLRQWFSLQPASPGISTGPNGRDKGGVIPIRASIFGEPDDASQDTATLRVGPHRTGNNIPAGAAAFPNGSGFTHYKWRLDLGPWSAETPSATPISLTSLAPGAHRVDVVGKRDAGLYQDDTNYGPVAAVTESRTWFVNTNTSALRINEILAANNGGFVHSNTTPDAVELYNASTNTIVLAGMRLTDDPTDPDKFIFPPGTEVLPGAYLVVFADSENTPGIHLGYTLSAEGEGLFLYASPANGGALLDSLVFGLQLDNLSIGRLAVGTWNLCQPTFGAANIAAPLGDPRRLRINEWLAIGLTLSPNDFIELYNFDSLPVALGGLYLTDEPIGWPGQHEIAALSFIGGGGYRAFIADGDATDGAEHLNFTLSPEQGTIGLANRDLSLIDCVVYLSQRIDISQGRSPNGSSNIVVFALPTPGAPNPSAVNTNSGIVINEVLANNASLVEPDGTTPDWVEFHNLSTNTVDIGDMSFTDSSLVPRRYVFAPGTTIGPTDYLRLRCDPTLPASTTNAGFGLKASGGSLFLFDKPANGGGPVSAVSHGLQTADFSIGRVPNGSTNWVLNVPTPNAANSAATLGNVSLVKVNEWMASPSSGDDWFELYNPNAQPVSIGGMFLTDNLANRTKSPIPTLSFLGGSSNGWHRFWADSNPGAGADHVSFALGANGEAVGFSASASVAIDSITFGAQQSGVSEGRFPDGGATVVRFPQTSSPGEANYLSLSNVVINEALTHTDLPFEDAIELRNLTGTNVNIGNWWLSDSKTALKKYRIPSGTRIAPHGFVVFYEFQFNADTNDLSSFSLSSKGDQIFLSAANTNGVLTGFRDEADFGAAQNGVSFGRYMTSDARKQFVAMSERSFGENDPGSVEQFRGGTGQTNPYPRVGPVVISQIMYHPPDIITNDNSIDEFIELKNITANAVPLYDVTAPTNTWRLRDAVDFDFPQGVSIPANTNLVLVSFDPVANPGQLALFRGLYGIPTSVPVYGPYLGRLANNDDKVELYHPDLPDFGDVPYIQVDRIHYVDLPPWPQAADGSGFSMRRWSLTGFGNDPTNWFAGAPSFGGVLDSDGDGMPNWWENQFTPVLNPNVDDANHDADGDGMTNLQEYQAGTNPTQSSSALHITAIVSSGASVSLSFFAVSNKTYVVEHKEFLGAPWTALTNIAASSVNRSLQIDTVVPTASRFYRLRSP